MRAEDIHGKKLIAVAGKDSFGKSFINVVNQEIKSKNLLMIGININEEDFAFFISNLSNSKVEVTIFMPEYQKKAAEFFKLDGYLVMSYKEGEDLRFIVNGDKKFIDDRALLELSNKISF